MKLAPAIKHEVDRSMLLLQSRIVKKITWDRMLILVEKQAYTRRLGK